MSSSRVNLEEYRIPLEEIVSATHNFSSETEIGRGGAGVIFGGQLSARWQNRRAAFKRLDHHDHFGQAEFLTMVDLMCRLTHENINPFIGYCDEADEMVIVSEYANNQSLWDHLEDPDKRRDLNWVQRLKICEGAAKGLDYLHSGVAEGQLVIHRNIKSQKLLLNEELEAKICSFNLSILVDRDQEQVEQNVVGTFFYMDPLYRDSGNIKMESDVYSFGVVMFELLSGMFAYQRTSFGDNKRQTLIKLVRRYYDDGLDNLIDPHIRDQISWGSFRAFAEIAYQCISCSIEDRPPMNTIIKRIQEALEIQNHEVASTIAMRIPHYQNHESLATQNISPQICIGSGGSATEGQLSKWLTRDSYLEEYLIPLEEITLATGNFNPENEIGRGGASVIFKGQLSERWQNRIAAFKRLKTGPFFGQAEFLNSVEFMCTFNHENIIPFIGYCDEADEMIIISEYANNQSLRDHLDEPDKRRSLTWAQRLKICLGAAAGLGYLHSGLGEGRLVIHRNIKSGKLLLNNDLEAKISSFNLSILVDKNQPPVSDEVLLGTDFYLDPLCKEGADIKIESEIYSFGVVLFEVLSGMFAFERRSVGDNQQQTLISLVRRYYDDGLDNLIDPYIRDHINIRSFRVFKKIAYQCISWNLKDRPTMNTIMKRIQEALDIQNHEAASPITVPSHQNQNIESFAIPLEAILLATQNFSQQTYIRGGVTANVYIGQLSEQWQNRTAAIKRFDQDSDQKKDEFRNELKMVSSFHHENIIGFIGYCDEANEMVIVYDYAIHGSLRQHLYEPEFSLTWAQRLQICIGAARGLEYLHSCLGEENRVIHRDIKSKSILLDDKLEAKISDFALSLLVDRNQPQVYDVPPRISYCKDPIYEESGLVNIQSDIYSFGLLMLETLSGTPVYRRMTIGDDPPQTLVYVVRHYYHEGLDMLIDSAIGDQINIHSFRAFIKIVYRCVSLKIEDRPTMKKIIKQLEEARGIQNQEGPSAITTRSHQHHNLENFRISLKEINLAIKDFSKETPIGDGGYGNVYKAQLSELRQNCTVAIKCLDPEGHQGKEEFLNEVKLISSFHHRNIISFVGYCDEGDQMIIVSKYAVNGSLDHHLRDPSKRNRLTWTHRLKICLGAAKGLDYLHWGLGKDNRVIHRDIKSANILLDENMEAKICDFGLSRESLRNQQDSHVYTKVAGTDFYLDPLYRETNVLTKESDVYSFGVVLFEILSGMLAYGPQPLISLVRRYYMNEPEKLIDSAIRDEIDNSSFHTFKELAFRCISLNFGERPTMDRIIDKIEDAIDFQEHEV